MTLSIAQIQNWAWEIVEQVKSGNSVEDSLVELKREFIDHSKAALRIAGHANAAIGADIIWIIGLDEGGEVIGVEPEKFEDWWAQVKSYFDGDPPTLTDAHIYDGEKVLKCLSFQTTEPPYVVKNPKHGGAWVVPWREGTSLRTAKRKDLIRLLLPRKTLPGVDVMGGRGSLSPHSAPWPVKAGYMLNFEITLYLFPRQGTKVTIPFHRCQCILSDHSGHNSTDIAELWMQSDYLTQSTGGSLPDSSTIIVTPNELTLNGSGKCKIIINHVFETKPDWLDHNALRLHFILHVIDCEFPLEINVEAVPLILPTGLRNTLDWSVGTNISAR